MLTEDPSLEATAIPAESNQPWRVTSADWPTATEDFYAHGAQHR